MARRTTLDLSKFCPAWRGWTLSRYGRARDWRLIAPNGATFQPAEIESLRAVLLDLDYLRLRVRELELRAIGVRVTTAEAAALAEAGAVLGRLFAAVARRRLRTITEPSDEHSHRKSHQRPASEITDHIAR